MPTLIIPDEHYDTIVETLVMDSESSRFDREIRDQIQLALESIEELSEKLPIVYVVGTNELFPEEYFFILKDFGEFKKLRELNEKHNLNLKIYNSSSRLNTTAEGVLKYFQINLESEK
jgi:hypothetical protein